MIRRLLTIALLFGALQLIIPLDERRAASALALLVFGFLVLAAYTVGESAPALALPKITGYLFAGILFGPWALNVVTTGVTIELEPVNRLAIALIAFLAGAELRWRELRERARVLLTVLGTELVLSFVAIGGLLLALRRVVPFLQGTRTAEAVALAALFAAVAIVHSPAVVMALLTETRAKGEVARTSLGIVLVADVVVVLAFSAALALVRSIMPATNAAAGAAQPTLGLVAWEIGGSVVVGALLGAGISLYLRFVQRELMLFAIVIAFFGAEIARLLHVEVLLTLLVAGFVTENLSRQGGAELLAAMERSAAPVFVVFFALAGAVIDLGTLPAIWPLAVGIVAVRAVAIWAGSAAGARWSNAAAPVRRHTWTGLIAQAGVAIGLVTVVADAYPSRGAQIQTLLLSVIAINQLLGPVLARWGLVKAGEVQGPGVRMQEAGAAEA